MSRAHHRRGRDRDEGGWRNLDEVENVSIVEAQNVEEVEMRSHPAAARCRGRWKRSGHNRCVQKRQKCTRGEGAQRTGSGVVVVVRWQTQDAAKSRVSRFRLGLTLFVGVEASLRFAGPFAGLLWFAPSPMAPRRPVMCSLFRPTAHCGKSVIYATLTLDRTCRPLVEVLACSVCSSCCTLAHDRTLATPIRSPAWC